MIIHFIFKFPVFWFRFDLFVSFLFHATQQKKTKCYFRLICRILSVDMLFVFFFHYFVWWFCDQIEILMGLDLWWLIRIAKQEEIGLVYVVMNLLLVCIGMKKLKTKWICPFHHLKTFWVSEFYRCVKLGTQKLSSFLTFHLENIAHYARLLINLKSIIHSNLAAKERRCRSLKSNINIK